MKKSFVTGLAILLPLAMTIVVIAFIVNLLTEPFLDMVKGVLNYYGIFSHDLGWISSEKVQLYLSKFIILVLIFGFTLLLGFLTRWVIVHYFIKIGDQLLHRIPLFNTIYKTFQEVSQTIVESSSKSFKQVVLVPFPHGGCYSVGLITSDEVNTGDHDSRLAVFVPTTPNPTSGFLLFFRPDEVTFLDLSVESALKYVISCGVVSSTFQKVSKEEAMERLHRAVLEDEKEGKE